MPSCMPASKQAAYLCTGVPRKGKMKKQSDFTPFGNHDMEPPDTTRSSPLSCMLLMNSATGMTQEFEASLIS